MISAIIQARMGSSRLPGKVLKKVNGRTLLEIEIERVKQSRRIDQIIVATSFLEQDLPIVHLCNELGIDCYRGSETDVLSRYYHAAKEFDVKTIVRITADCPLIDPVVIDNTIELFFESQSDYAANTVPPDTSAFPDGSDVEVFSRESLTRAFNEATDPSDREHVTFYFWKRDHGFKTIQLKHLPSLSAFRFTVDYPEDLIVIEQLFCSLKENGQFGYINEIIAELDKHPELRMKNAMHYFGEGWKNA